MSQAVVQVYADALDSPRCCTVDCAEPVALAAGDAVECLGESYACKRVS